MGIIRDVISIGKKAVKEGIQHLTHTREPSKPQAPQVQKPEKAATNNTVGYVRDSVDVRQEESVNTTAARTQAYQETRLELKNVRKEEDQTIENVEKKGILDRIFDKLREFLTGKGPRKGEKEMEEFDGYNKLSHSQKDKVLDIYERHQSSENLESLKTLAKDERLNKNVIGGLEALDDPDYKVGDGISRDQLVKQALSDIADPSSISEGSRIIDAQNLAKNDPALYLEKYARVNSKDYQKALTALDDHDGFNNLTLEQQDRVIGLYENHAAPETIGSLETLAKDGRINENVISELEELDNPDFKLAKGIDRDELFKEALSDIADPSHIAQKNKGTCAATSIQIALAVKDPARYLETLRLLSSKSGDASEIADGLVRTDQSPINDTNDPRSITVRIMSPAFMEYADGADLTYKNKEDAHYNDEDIKDHGGLYASESAYLYDGVLDEKTNTIYFNDDNREENLQTLRDSTTGPIPVSLKWGLAKDGVKHTYHKVLLERIDKDPETGEEYAYVINPWGKQDRIPIEDFNERVRNATIPENASTYNEPAKQNDLSKYNTRDFPDLDK